LRRIWKVLTGGFERQSSSTHEARFLF
jgi:hypothetical protein